MKTLAARIAVLAITALSLTTSMVSIARAEGGGAGGGKLPPPVFIVAVTDEYVLWDNGLMVYSDGSIGYIH